MSVSARTEWTRLNAARTRRRRFVTVSATLALAAMVLLVVQFSTGRGVRPPPRRPVAATLSSATGAVIVETQPFANDVPTPTAGTVIRATRIVRTNPGVFATLTLANGTSVRVEESTRVRLLSAQEIELFDGRITIDATAVAEDESPLQIRTARAAVSAAAGRFQVSLKVGRLEVRMIEGEADVSSGSQTVHVARQGVVVVEPNGEMKRALE